jgi:D-3-phosphoglycerate dehydrogenase / 2-oxoglutarate reductase
VEKGEMFQHVVVTDYNFEALGPERAIAEKLRAKFSAHQCKTAGEVAKAVKGASVAVVQFAPLTDAAIKGLRPGARIIRYGVGYDNIDLVAAKSHGCAVAYVPDYCTNEVADHTASLLLCLLRKITALDRSVREGQWNSVAVARPMPPFADTMVGFLGLGRIGRSVLERLRPFGFEFAVFDPALDDHDVALLGARRMTSPEALFARVDALTLHLPATAQTRQIINRSTLAGMKPNLVLVNTARGELVDEAAFASALNDGIIAGGALDVFATEPLPAGHVLRGAKNLILSPHAAWYSDESGDKLQNCVAEEIGRGLAGKPPRQPVPAGS